MHYKFINQLNQEYRIYLLKKRWVKEDGDSFVMYHEAINTKLVLIASWMY